MACSCSGQGGPFGGVPGQLPTYPPMGGGCGCNDGLVAYQNPIAPPIAPPVAPPLPIPIPIPLPPPSLPGMRPLPQPPSATDPGNRPKPEPPPRSLEGSIADVLWANQTRILLERYLGQRNGSRWAKLSPQCQDALADRILLLSRTLKDYIQLAQQGLEYLAPINRTIREFHRGPPLFGKFKKCLDEIKAFTEDLRVQTNTFLTLINDLLKCVKSLEDTVGEALNNPQVCMSLVKAYERSGCDDTERNLRDMKATAEQAQMHLIRSIVRIFRDCLHTSLKPDLDIFPELNPPPSDFLPPPTDLARRFHQHLPRGIIGYL